MIFTVHDIPSRWRHPDIGQFHACLRAADVAARFDALCAAHPRRGPDVPVAARHAAVAAVDRRFVYNKVGKYWSFREKVRYPKYCGLGLDVRIDARVELALLFATPRGHISAPLPVLVRNLRRETDPEFCYRPPNPAPRIETVEELPSILTESLALYDALADAIRAVEWWWPDTAASVA